MAPTPLSLMRVQCSGRGISRVLRVVHCPFVGASVPEYHNPVVADFLPQARPPGRFVSSDSGGVDRPLPRAGVLEQYSTRRKILLREACIFRRRGRSRGDFGVFRHNLPARLADDGLIFPLCGRDPAYVALELVQAEFDEVEGRKVSRLGGVGSECSEADRSGGERSKEGPDRHCGLRSTNWGGSPNPIVAAVPAL
jgi:hypothetical protein